MREELREELEETLAYVGEQNTYIKALDRELAPYWLRARELKQRLVRSHHWISGDVAKRTIDSRVDPQKDIVIGLRPETACERYELFAELDRLNVVHAPTRGQRRVAKLEAEAAQRAADRIRELLAKPPKSGRRTRPATGDLFR